MATPPQSPPLCSAPLSPASVVVRTADLLAADVDDEVVLMSVARGQYFGLSETGPAIWQLLAQPMRVSDLCADLAGKFDGPADRIEADVLAFLADLLREGLIEQRDQPGT